MESQSKTRYSSLENALRLLNLFTVRKSDWQVKEIAEKLQIAESTAHRLLTTLQSEGFIAKDVSTNTYRLGINILAFHPVIALNYPLMEKAHHILVKLKESLQQTVQIGVLQGSYVYYISRNDYYHVAFDMNLKLLDRRAPFYCTSAGKILMCRLSENNILKVAEQGFHKFTNETITSSEQLLEERKKISKCGFAISINELYKDLSSIAVPIYDRQRKIMAALEVIGPSEKISEFKIKDVVKVLKNTAAKISEL